MNESTQSLQSSELSSQQASSPQTTLSQVVDEIAVLLQNIEQLDRKEYDARYATFYKVKQQIEQSGQPVDTEQLLLQEARLNDLNQQYRKIERERNEALVAKQLENSAQVETLLNELESLLDESVDFKVIYDNFHRIREQWESLRPLSQQEESRLGKRFVALRDAFYELKHINEELRDYDFRKNLEMKQSLLEELRQIDQDEDVIRALTKLDSLVGRWRDVGPVAREEREAIHGEYKVLTSNVYKRHQSYQDNLRETETQNAQLKEDIIVRLQAYVADMPKTIGQWTKASEEIKGLQEEWKGIGRSTKRVNAEQYHKFRELCDQFFLAKQEFFKQRRQVHGEAVSMRKVLIDRANELIQGKQFNEIAEGLKGLQEEWKRLPNLRKEESDTLWAEFRKPFDEFYQRKREYDRKQHGMEHHNEQRKRAILADLQTIANQTEELPNNLKEKLAKIKEEWKKVGRASQAVNDKLWEEFCQLNDTLYDRLRELTSRRGEQVKARYQKLSEQPQGVRTEMQFLQRKIDRLKTEIRNYDNNLNYLSSNSKDGVSPLLLEVEKKRNRLGQDLERVEDELRILRSMEAEK